MTWQPIIVGVDGSPESVRAAVLGSVIAEAAGTRCLLVHAAMDYWSSTAMPTVGVDMAALDEATVDHSRSLIVNALTGRVPDALLTSMVIRIGPPAAVLVDVAREEHASLIVAGGKHRRGIARLAGSTVTNLVRLSEIPILATDGGSGGIRRVLAAVDLSHAAAPTLAAAELMAALFAADMRALHVVEPLPTVPTVPLELDEDEVYRAAEKQLATSVWPLLTYQGADTVIRRGRTAAVIVDEAEQWRADLVVVGSHGKGWVDRLILGSTSERLLHVLPTLTMVVPAHGPSEPELAGAIGAHGRLEHAAHGR